MALARLPETVQARSKEPLTYTQWGSKVEHMDLTQKAKHPRVGSECILQHFPGSTVRQGMREKAYHPRTGPRCLLTIEEGDERGKVESYTLPSAPSWDSEIEETALFFKFWVTELKLNKRFADRPSSGGRSGAVTIS